MTNQENLPVWAKILLGIPTEDTVLPAPPEREEKANSSQRESAPSEPAAMEQSVIVLGRSKRERKWDWKTALCPCTREANS
jgi:hypothetical protein